MTLELEERPDAIASPWNLMLRTEEQPPRELRRGTSIISVFNQIGTGRSLLILGEPGSGKTISLLQLARDLIERAEQDVSQLIPVVFNLSSWSTQRKPLIFRDWLIAELGNKYQVPRKLANDWIQQQQLCLLLDGLDEVRAVDRDSCVSSINAFQQDQGTEVVVCSRTKDYKKLTHYLNVQNAIYLRSLTPSQIHHYLTQLQTDLTGLRTLLSNDAALQELAPSPLMLNIMVLAYQGMTVTDLPKTEVVEERRKQLFNTYIERMFNRPNRSKLTSRYSQTQTLYWLIWLAQRMVQNSPTLFLIESMQPSWLQMRTETIAYRVILNSIIWLPFVLLGGLNFVLLGDIGPLGLLFLLFGVLSELLSGEITLVEIQGFSIQKAIKNGLCVGKRVGRHIVLNIGLTGGSALGLAGGLALGLTGGPVAGLFFGLLGGLLGLLLGLLLGFLAGLSAGLLAGLSAGLTFSDLETTIAPNEGIWRSARSFVISVLLFGLIGVLFFWLLFGLTVGLSAGLQFGLFFGLTVGLFFGLVYGGATCIQHFSLRLALCLRGQIPWNYARFLDHAIERLFLQRVGGGYIFVHRLLMEHFAQMKIE